MGEGWRRGARGIDGNKGSDIVNRGTDYGEKPAHDISSRDLKQACDPWDEPTWKPGVVSSSPKKGGRGSPDGTDRPVDAYSPTSGKYAKKGGSGQRSGA